MIYRRKREVGDKLKIEYINSLPQPIFVRSFGDTSLWPLETICVETGLLRFDVVSKLQNGHIGDVAEFIDGDGRSHDPESFYIDCDAPVPS